MQATAMFPRHLGSPTRIGRAGPRALGARKTAAPFAYRFEKSRRRATTTAAAATTTEEPHATATATAAAAATTTAEQQIAQRMRQDGHHLDTSAFLLEKAVEYSKKGMPIAAMAACGGVLAIRHEVLGGDHELTGDACYHLAAAHDYVGGWELSKQYYEAAARAYTQACGKDTKKTLDARERAARAKKIGNGGGYYSDYVTVLLGGGYEATVNKDWSQHKLDKLHKLYVDKEGHPKWEDKALYLAKFPRLTWEQIQNKSRSTFK